MWHAARAKDRIAKHQREALAADVEVELAFEHLEPLVLIMVEVTRRTAFLMKCTLDDEQRPCSCSGQLEVQHRRHPVVALAV